VTGDYSSAACDLCRSSDCEVLVEDAVGMWSDGRPSRRGLRKVVCRQCGLVREGSSYTAAELTAHYGDAYELNTVAGGDHWFYRNGVAVSRSDAFVDWAM
jgi:hypothetical protein